jgi:hypothetical protein
MIAALVDYLDGHEVVKPFANTCIKRLENSIANPFSEESIQWLCTPQVFSKGYDSKHDNCRIARVQYKS